MNFVTRFAPSPTGRLHLGHAFPALLAHDAAASQPNGRLVLRIEDIDSERCRNGFVAAILDDLRWLGIDWSGELVLQSTHGAAHAAALDQLSDLGLLYPCICTRTEIAASASAPHDVSSPYPGTCRRSPPAPDEWRPVAWRIDVARAAALVGSLDWDEIDSGRIAADPTAGGDVVLARKAYGVAYHLAVVVDDASAGVTHIVRGRDLFAATPVQRLLQELLGLPKPTYRHHLLVLGPDRRRLAKRTPGSRLCDMRADRLDPTRVIADLRRGLLPAGFTFDASV